MVKYTITLVNLTMRYLVMKHAVELSIKLIGINRKGLNKYEFSPLS